ncbi:MAG: hypothetical protein ACI3Y0_10905 [Prevotella sp.]
MTKKIFSTILTLMALVLVGCSDTEEYNVATGNILSKVETGTAQVGATNATITGTVLDLSEATASSYVVGVSYSTTDDATKGTKVPGTLAEDGMVTTTLTGLKTDVTYYYCTYVTLQGKVTQYGEVKQFLTTDAEIATADAAYTEVSATLGGTVNIASAESDEVVRGIRVSLDESKVNEGRLYEAAADGSNTFSLPLKGIIPGRTYFYVAYASVNGEEKFGQVKSFTTPSQDVEFVDLGLTVEWATVNVGAANPEEAGGLYGYGDNTLFNISTQAADYFHGDIQASENDIATMYIPGAFTPNKVLVEELVNNTKQSVEELNGVRGVRFTANNGNSIFLPFTGTRIGSETTAAESLGAYWSASMDAVDNDHAGALSIGEDGAKVVSANVYEGLAIRAVRMPSYPLELEKLCKTWALDLDADAKSVVWGGPISYYGTADSWDTVTNGYTVSGDSWCWAPTWADNTWICDAKNRGTMTFKTDGTVEVNDLGNGAKYTGTYSVDLDKKTITLNGAEILHLEGFHSLVSNWSKELKVLSLSDKGLQIAALRDQSDEGPCLLAFNYVDAALVGGGGSEMTVNNANLVYGDLEGNGKLRLEIYNEFGSTKENPVVIPSTVKFAKNLAVTFKLEGITLKEGAAGSYNAGMSFADADWSPSYWGGNPKFDAIVNGDGTYTCFFEPEGECDGAVVFCIDIVGLGADIADMSTVKAEIVSVVADQDPANLYTTVAVDNSKLLFNNKDGNGTDGRIEIYNEYGDSKANPCVNTADVNFAGRMTITFTISGIDGNLVDGATPNYKSEISYADADWSPSYWGGAAVGSANVTGDGTYTVYADMGPDTCEGAVVWCIELYGLWKDLADPSKVKVNIDQIVTETAK